MTIKSTFFPRQRNHTYNQSVKLVIVVLSFNSLSPKKFLGAVISFTCFPLCFVTQTK